MQEAMPGPRRLVRVRTVRGEPYEVRGRRLIPLARMVSLGRARATIGTHRLEGRGWGLAYVKPLSMIVDTPGGVRLAKVAVRDGTSPGVGAHVPGGGGPDAAFCGRALVGARTRAGRPSLTEGARPCL